MVKPIRSAAKKKKTKVADEKDNKVGKRGL